jgi:Synaptobrevin
MEQPSSVDATFGAVVHVAWLCRRFNDLKGVDKTAMVQAQVNEVAATMSKAVTAAVERGEKATDLQDRTHQLAQTADKFEHGSKTLKNQMMWRNAKVRV